MEQSAIGAGWLEGPDPLVMFTIDQAAQSITPAKWYYELNATLLASAHAGQPLDYPLNGRVMPRWKRYVQ